MQPISTALLFRASHLAGPAASGARISAIIRANLPFVPEMGTQID